MTLGHLQAIREVMTLRICGPTLHFNPSYLGAKTKIKNMRNATLRLRYFHKRNIYIIENTNKNIRRLQLGQGDVN